VEWRRSDPEADHQQGEDVGPFSLGNPFERIQAISAASIADVTSSAGTAPWGRNRRHDVCPAGRQRFPRSPGFPGSRDPDAAWPWCDPGESMSAGLRRCVSCGRGRSCDRGSHRPPRFAPPRRQNGPRQRRGSYGTRRHRRLKSPVAAVLIESGAAFLRKEAGNGQQRAGSDAVSLAPIRRSENGNDRKMQVVTGDQLVAQALDQARADQSGPLPCPVLD